MRYAKRREAWTWFLLTLLVPSVLSTQSMVLGNATIVQVDSGRILTGQAIVIQGERIESIVDASSYRSPEGVRSIVGRHRSGCLCDDKPRR